MYKWVSGITKNRALTRIETLWGDVQRMVECGGSQHLVSKLQIFVDEFEMVYNDHVDADSGVPLDKVYGDLSHVLLGILDILQKGLSATPVSDDSSAVEHVSAANVFERLLSLAEKILRDEKYQQVMHSTPDALSKLVSLLQKASTAEGKVTALKVVVHLGQTIEDKLAIIRMKGIQKIMHLLGSDQKLLLQINLTFQHFLQDSNSSKASSREGSTSSPNLNPSNSQQLAPALGSLVKVGLTMFARASQHLVKIVGSRRASNENFKDSGSSQVQQVLKYSPLPALRVAHIVESVELLQLVPSTRVEGANTATIGSLAPSVSSDLASNDSSYQPPGVECHYLVKELILSQGILQKLTLHLKEAALEVQVELISILGQFLQGSTNAKLQFKSLDGYSIFGVILSSVTAPDSPTCSALLDRAFPILEAIVRDSSCEYAGNIDAFLLLAKLARGQNHLSIRWRAANSIMVLINENPENAAVFLGIRGFHVLIECLPQLPQMPESYSDPLHSHFRNFLFHVVQICLAGATLLDHYCLSIVECMAANLIRLPATAESTNPAAPCCQPIVQSVLVQCIFTALSQHSFESKHSAISLELVQNVIALIDFSSPSFIMDLSADVAVSDVLEDPWNKTAAEHGIIDSIYMTEVAKMMLWGIHSDLTNSDAISCILTVPRLLAAISTHCVSNLLSSHALSALHSTLLHLLELLPEHVNRATPSAPCETSVGHFAPHLRNCTRELASAIVMSYSQKDTPTVKRILALKALTFWCHTACSSWPHVSEVYRATLMYFDALHSIFGTWRLAGPELARACLSSVFAFMHCSKFVRSRVQAAMSPLQFAANICNNSNLKWDPSASFMLFSILGIHPDSGHPLSPQSAIESLSALPACGLVREDSAHLLWTGLRWPIVVDHSTHGVPVTPLARSPSGEFNAHGANDFASESFKFDAFALFQNLSYSNFQFHGEYEASVAIHIVDQCAPSSQAHLSAILAETFSQSPRNCLLASSAKGLEIFVDRFALLSETDESRNGIMALITKLGQYSIRSQALSALLKCALDDPSLDKNLQALFVIGEICGRDSPGSYFELFRKPGSQLLISYPDRLPSDKVGFTIACWLRVWEWGGDSSTLFEFRDHIGNCFAEVTLMKSLEREADPNKRLVCIEVLADAKERAKSPVRAKSPILKNFAPATQGQDPAVSSSTDASSGLFQFTSYEYKADGCWQLLTISFSKNGVALSINGKSLQTLGNVAYPSNVRSMQVILGSDNQDSAMHATVSSVSVCEGVVDSTLCSGCYESGAMSSLAPRVTSAKKPLLVLAPQLFADRTQKDSFANATSASNIDTRVSHIVSFLSEIPLESDNTQSSLASEAANLSAAQRRPQASGVEVGFTDRLLAGLRSFRDDSSEVELKEKEVALSSPQKIKATPKDATAIGSGVVVHLTSFIWEAINQKTGPLRLLKAVANAHSQVAALQVLTRLLHGSTPLRENFAASCGYYALTAILQAPKVLNSEILECLTCIASCSLSTERRSLKDAHCAVLLADLSLHADVRTQHAILALISDSITGLPDARAIWRDCVDLRYSKFTLWLDELAPECRRNVAMIIGSNFDSYQVPDVQFVCQWLVTKPGTSMDIRADLLEHLVELWHNGTASLSLLRPSNPKAQHEAFDFALALMLNPHDGIQSVAVRLLSMILCSSKSAREYFHKTFGWLAVVTAVCESKQYTTNVKGPGPELCKALLCAAMGNLSMSSSSHSSSSGVVAQKLMDPNAIQALMMFLSERDTQSHIVSTMLLKLIGIIVASGADPTKEKPEYQTSSNMSISLADAGMLHWLKILWRRWGDSDPDLSGIMLLSRSASQSDLAAIFAQDRLRSESESSRTGSLGTSDDTDELSDADERSETESISTDGTGAPMADSVRVLIRSLARIVCLADLLRSKPRLPTLLAPEIDDDTDAWGRLVRAEVVHAFDRMPRLFEANTTSSLKAFVALMQPMLLHQRPKDIFILMGLIQAIKNLTLRSTPAVRGSFADSGFSKLSDDSCRVSCRAAIFDPELASILLASNTLGEFALMPVFSKFECTDVLALLLVLHRSMADKEPRGALVRRSAISLRDRLGSDATWRTSLQKVFDEDSGNRDVESVVAYFSKSTQDDAAQAWLKSYMTSSQVESREAVDALLQRKWQQLHLPASGSTLKTKEGESQWSSFFYSLFDKGGSEESGSTKARIDKAKKLADYDRRVLESKENIAVWMTHIKAIVDASRKTLDDGAAAMRDGAKARVLQGQKVLQKLGEAHTQLRHRRNDSGSGVSHSDSGASDREGGIALEQLPSTAGTI